MPTQVQSQTSISRLAPAYRCHVSLPSWLPGYILKGLQPRRLRPHLVDDRERRFSIQLSLVQREPRDFAGSRARNSIRHIKETLARRNSVRQVLEMLFHACPASVWSQNFPLLGHVAIDCFRCGCHLHSERRTAYSYLLSVL